MAVVIPLVMAYAGASATVIMITTVALTVTGINAKINKSASKVFGEDFVKVANIAGAVYGAYSAMNPDSIYSVQNLGSAAEGASEAAIATQAAAEGAVDLAEFGGADIAENLSTTAADTAIKASTDATAAVGNAGVVDQAVKQLAPGQNLADLAKPQDQINQELMGAREVQPSALKQVQGPALDKSIEEAAKKKALEGTNFFDKLMNDKGGQTLLSEGLKGVAGAYQSASAARQKQSQYEAEIARKDRLNNMGLGGWKQTQ